MFKSNFIALVFAIVIGTSSPLHSSNGKIPKFKVGDMVVCTFEGFNHSYEFVFDESLISPDDDVHCFIVKTYVINEHGRSKHPTINFFMTKTSSEDGIFREIIDLRKETISISSDENTATYAITLKKNTRQDGDENIQDEEEETEMTKKGKWKYYPKEEGESEE